MNVLILSCGTRNKIIQYMRKELAGKGMVIATDMSPNAPALYEADKHYLVPRYDGARVFRCDSGYLPEGEDRRSVFSDRSGIVPFGRT